MISDFHFSARICKCLEPILRLVPSPLFFDCFVHTRKHTYGPHSYSFFSSFKRLQNMMRIPIIQMVDIGGFRKQIIERYKTIKGDIIHPPKYAMNPVIKKPHKNETAKRKMVQMIIRLSNFSIPIPSLEALYSSVFLSQFQPYYSLFLIPFSNLCSLYLS